VVSPATVRAILEYVTEQKGYGPADGAVGIRGRLATVHPDSTFEGHPVQVVGCESALAAREALLGRRPDRWLVIVTDRPEDDLGAGVLAHLVGQELRTPDPWQAVRQRFRAVSVDARLTAGRGHRGIALGLMELTPPDGWPAAPAGVLSQDHAYGAVAERVLELGSAPSDIVGVLAWTTTPRATDRLAELRRCGGDDLADALIGWIAYGVGEVAAPIVGHLLRNGRPGDLIPLGLVVGLLDGLDDPPAALAMARLGHHWEAGRAELDASLRAVGTPSATVIAGLLADRQTRPDAVRVIAQADQLVREAQAEPLAEHSDLLRLGLTRRLHRLADLLAGDPSPDLARVESTWAAVGSHLLAGADDPRLPAFHAAVRLVRWLAETGGPEPSQPGFAALARRQSEVDGWVDSAVNDAAAGVDDADLAAGLAAVLDRVRRVRDRHDREFAMALAPATADELGMDGGFLEHNGGRVYLLEQMLDRLILPIAREPVTPLLLLILDGMSTGVATEILDDLLNHPSSGWAEALPEGSSRRAAGLAVLPTITEASRASLLSGELTRGQQDVERRNFAALTTAHGLGNAALFHKKILDTTRLGFSVSDQVRTAIDDVTGQPLVTCVLNTIDDALDRSDPAGTTWTADTVKHLRPLLERARGAGRTVVLTADHGHVVERRQGTQRPASGGGARHRPAEGAVRDDEVLVTGPRVLEPGGRVVLAVDERLRYGPLKAGYHGGGAPAEAIVPVVFLVPVEQADAPGVRLAPPQEPSWWSGPVVRPAPVAAPVIEQRPPTLFDEPEITAPVEPWRESSWGARLVASPVYAAQREVAGRVVLGDEQVAALIDRLAGAPHRRLSGQAVAAALSVPPTSLVGAIEQLRKLLNVEGYSVISRDTGTGEVIMDADLAAEQFELSP
jgi:hypothetical protein